MVPLWQYIQADCIDSVEGYVAETDADLDARAAPAASSGDAAPGFIALDVPVVSNCVVSRPFPSVGDVFLVLVLHIPEELFFSMLYTISGREATSRRVED